MDRTDRIAEEMKREISEIIRMDLKDPRLPDLISVILVKVTKDLRHAKVYVSVFGDKEKKNNAIEALQKAAGFVRKELGHRMSIRYTPEIQFILDDSIEQGIHISEVLRNIDK